MIYKIYCTNILAGATNAAMTVGAEPQVSFIFDPANTNYVNFKKQIAEETAELQNADGNTMTTEEVTEFIATLP
jgi:hypothetical protein